MEDGVIIFIVCLMVMYHLVRSLLIANTKHRHGICLMLPVAEKKVKLLNSAKETEYTINIISA